MYAFAKYVALVFFLPPGGPILLVIAGLAIVSWRPRLGRAIAMAGIAVLWLLSSPLVVSLLIEQFGSAHPADIEEARQAQAIVVLGAGLRRNAREYGGETVSRLTLERVRYAAALARETGLPILVTGGVPAKSRRAEADLMRQVLDVEFKTKVRWVEGRSANTRENAINSAALLRADGISRIVLVSHAFDVPRARRRFEEVGMQVVSAPVQVPTVEWHLSGLLPSAGAAQDGFYLGYEALARLADRFVPGR